jgi:hypothetical protein
MDPYRENGVVRGLVDRQLHASIHFPSEIHRDDEMYRYNLESLRGCRGDPANVTHAVGGIRHFAVDRRATAILVDPRTG